MQLAILPALAGDWFSGWNADAGSSQEEKSAGNRRIMKIII